MGTTCSIRCSYAHNSDYINGVEPKGKPVPLGEARDQLDPRGTVRIACPDSATATSFTQTATLTRMDMSRTSAPSPTSPQRGNFANVTTSPTTEADLIASIEADPDDVSSFLVYADHLQGRGDPRGELIALMHAGASDDVHAQRADELLRANQASLLGKLARSASIRIEAWRLGFVDRVRIVADHDRHAVQLLDEVLDHPSCRFVRHLELLILGKRPSYVAVEARLLGLARPSTLTTLVLGKPGKHALSPELLGAFPRLTGQPAAWNAIAAAIGRVRGAGLGFAAEDVAPLALPVDGACTITPDAIARGLHAEVGRRKPIGLVTRLRATCAPAALDAYVAGLVTAAGRTPEEARTEWVYSAAALLGGPEAAAAIGGRLPRASARRAALPIDCLARMATPLATVEIFAATRLGDSRAEHADAVLDTLARQQSSDASTLLAHAGSDPGDASAPGVHARFRALDELIVEMLMATGWNTAFATAVELFARSPRHVWTHGLVWRAGHVLFALDARGAVGVTGDSIELATGAAVGLAHVAELPAGALDGWRAWQRERRPPFAQVDRGEGIDRRLLAALGAGSGRVRAPRLAWRVAVDALRERGYRGDVDPRAREVVRVAKRHVLRGVPHVVRIEPGYDSEGSYLHCWSTAHPLPPIVAFEAARDLTSTQAAVRAARA